MYTSIYIYITAIRGLPTAGATGPGGNTKGPEAVRGRRGAGGEARRA